MYNHIAVVDFGGQYAHLIANKIRRMHVFAEIRQPEDKLNEFDKFKGIILSGSPALISRGDEGVGEEIMNLSVPLLGLCFGHQEIIKHAGGEVKHIAREYGPATFHTVGDSRLFEGIPDQITVWMSHGDTVTKLPLGFRETGFSTAKKAIHHNAAIECRQTNRYGLQFHPEVDDTEFGDQILANFVFNICGCEPTWIMEDFVSKQVESIRSSVGDRSVLMLVSGGVDSTVCAKLLGMALGPSKLRLLHINNGFMRKYESEDVIEELKIMGLGESLYFIDASEEFLTAASGLANPEYKRRAIGDTFVRIFEREVEKIGGAMLGQGTIYPDTIESGGTKRSDTIKTHHNRVPIIKKMTDEGRVVEPIRDLYKTEVRDLGEKLGIASHMVWRHPFPGPGLSVRCLCTEVETDVLHFPGVDPSIMRCLDGTGLKGMLLPIMTTGVKADLRSYESPIFLWGQASHYDLASIANLLCAEVTGVNRCLVDLTGNGI